MRDYATRLVARLKREVSPEESPILESPDDSSILRAQAEALEAIARRVWGASSGPPRLRTQGVEELLREVERRIPAAVEGMANTVATIRAALRSDAPSRFRAFLSSSRGIAADPMFPTYEGGGAAEIGVHVEGRNVRLTALGSPGSAGYLESCAAATAAFAELVGDLSKVGRIEGDESGIDEQGRPFRWVRFGGPL